MNRKELVQEIAARLKKMRLYFGSSGPKIANRLRIGKTSYYRNELGHTSPDLWTYFLLGRELGVSLDWLILNQGEMLYKKEAGTKESTPDRDNLEPDVIELLEHMRKIPLLHYDILTRFHQFKEEHGSIVEREMKKNGAR